MSIQGKSAGSGFYELPQEGNAETYEVGRIAGSMGLTTSNFPHYVDAVIQQYVDRKYTSEYTINFLHSC